ncbi:MAG: hypothetical protein U5K38_06155 [Woeseiaceae bacterium]|nr:hypothetical protein [Woeseiaceae bacterium]
MADVGGAMTDMPTHRRGGPSRRQRRLQRDQRRRQQCVADIRFVFRTGTDAAVNLLVDDVAVDRRHALHDQVEALCIGSVDAVVVDRGAYLFS